NCAADCQTARLALSFRRGLSSCLFQRLWIEIGPDLFDLAVDDAKEIENRHHRLFVSWQHECGFPKRRNAFAFYHMPLNLGFVHGDPREHASMQELRCGCLPDQRMLGIERTCEVRG